MGIQDRNHQFNIKRFTLTAIASAILTLQPDIASAASCPAQIVGTALAGLVCDFNSGTSVTVANGGQVGGINMISYNPLPPSYITINTGGSVSNTTGIGIAISSSSLSNGLSNSGTINSTSATGIAITNTSTISGGLSNSGIISAGALGINISNSIINGDILNTGQIISTNTGTGILIINSDINGGISNSGMITGSGVDSGITIFGGVRINGDIVNTGLINAENGNALLVSSSSTINGGISNGGTITSTGASGITIFNSSNVQGNISNSGTISGGLRGIAVHNAGFVNGSITNSGTINSGTEGISIFSATTISGGISNSGTITSGTTGIAIHSTATVNGGVSNSGTIQGDTKAVYIAADSNVSFVDILGQQARIIGVVDAVNTDLNITSGAVFTSEGTFAVNNFNISSNAIFNMANAITVANNVNNAGTLAVGESTQTIIGNYTQNTGGLFQVGVVSAANYGALIMSGAADLSSSGNINVQVAQNASLHAGDILSNVMSSSAFISPTNGYQVSDNSFLWQFTATPNLTNGFNLVAGIDPVATTVCQGSFCQGAANVIIGQVAAGNPAFNAYAALATASAFQTAASQATPELTNENMQVTQLVTKSVMDVVPMWGTLHGQSAGDAMLSEPGKVWLKPYGATSIQDKINSVDGYTATAYGLVLGKDVPLAGDSLFGGAFALGKNNMRGKAQLSGQTISSDVYQALVYAARKLPRNVYLAGQGLIGYGNNDTSRNIPLYASKAQGSYTSWFTNLRTQLGWNVYTLNQSLVLTPEVDASFMYINQNSYREHGSTMNLSVASSNNSSFVLGAYGNAAYHLASFEKTQYMTLTAYAGIARNILNTQPQTTATFVAGGPSFSTSGVQFNQTVFRGGVGLNIANPIKPLRVNINYDAQTGNNAYDGIGSVTISYKI